MKRAVLIGLAVVGVLIALVAFTPWFVGEVRQAERVTAVQAEGPYTFPEDFAWGVAVAAQHVEHQSPSDWTAFEKAAVAEGRTETDPRPGYAKPGHINALDTYSPEVQQKKVDFDARFGDDFRTLGALGLNAYRFSISWARLFPREDMTEPDPAGIDFYRQVIASLKRNGMTPYVTLFHFSSPEWLWVEKDGKKGFERADALEHWTRYVEAVVEALGGEVADWCTLNEPMVFVYNGYLEGVFPPNEQREGGPPAVAPVVHRLLEAHAIAYRIVHADAKKRGKEARVGITQHTRAFEPWRNWAPLDRIASGFVRQAFIWDPLDAIETGTYAMTNSDYEVEIEGLKGTQDYVGINYYGRYFVEVKLSNPAAPVIHFNDPSDSDEMRSDLDWAIHPKGFGEVLREAHQRYGKPIFVLENGMADGADDDTRRQAFLVSHLRELWSAKNEGGADIRGYFHWSHMDNFEWAEGFEARFGIIKVDYANAFARTLRPSARLYSDIIDKGVTDEMWAKYGPQFGAGK